ncbi:hypothetical protein HC256_009998 [Beauveria bassiana]|nr:hypothetical protein HC256_009998 [Beauveria bassiana]
MEAGTDDLRNAVINDGFWTIEDETIGKTLDELVNSGFHIQTVPGMELCNAAVFVPAGNGLFMLPNLAEESPVIRGLAPTEVTMDHGGLCTYLVEDRGWHICYVRNHDAGRE